jgi:hypothetical protein
MVVLLPLLVGHFIFNRSKKKFEPEELRSKE